MSLSITTPIFGRSTYVRDTAKIRERCLGPIPVPLELVRSWPYKNAFLYLCNVLQRRISSGILVSNRQTTVWDIARAWSKADPGSPSWRGFSTVMTGRRFQVGIVRGKNEYLYDVELLPMPRNLKLWLDLVRESVGISWVVGSATSLCTTLYIMVRRWFSRRCSKIDQPSWVNMAVTLLQRPLVTILAARLLILSILSFSLLVCGSQTTHPYLTDDLTRAKYANFLHCFGQYFRLRLTKLRVLLAFLVILSTCCSHSNLLLNEIPNKYRTVLSGNATTSLKRDARCYSGYVQIDHL